MNRKQKIAIVVGALVILILGGGVYLVISGTRRLPASGSLAKIHFSGGATGGVVTVSLRGTGGPPLDVALRTRPGDTAQSVADRLVEEMRKSSWPERLTWKPWVVGLRLTHVDEVSFRSTDVGLDIDLRMTTLFAASLELCVQGDGREPASGNMIVYGSGELWAGSSSQILFPAGQTSAELLDRAAQSLTRENWKVERKEGSLVCREVANGSVPRHMSLHVLRRLPDDAPSQSRDWTWGLRLVRP